jgi:DNA-binding transcriptional MerR regulator
MLTIGELGKRVGLPASTLRYYEKLELLSPAGRTEAGYRLYTPDVEDTLHFIKRAQRLGFSLADIRALLDTDAVVSIAEKRFLSLERELTALLVQRHEMQLFLLDFRQRVAEHPGEPASALFDRLVDQVCAGLPNESLGEALDWLFEQTGCTLSEPKAQRVIEALRGRHVHIWQDDGAYHILVVGHDPAVEAALKELTDLEAGCTIHDAPELFGHSEGYLLVARGRWAFVYARLFLSLDGDGRAAE